MILYKPTWLTGAPVFVHIPLYWIYVYIYICILHIRHVYYIHIYIYHHHHLPIVSHSMTGAPAVFPSSTFDLHQPDTNLAPGHQFFIVICESSLGLPWSPVILCVFGCRAYLGYPGKKRNIHGFNIKLWSYQRADLVRTYGFITIDSNHGQEIRLFFFGPNQKDQNSPIDVKEVQRLKQARSRTMSDLSLSAVAFHLSIRP